MLICVLACCCVSLVAPPMSSAACRPNAARPTITIGHVLALGRTACNVGTRYGYELCLEVWNASGAGRDGWKRLSCTGKMTWPGSVRLSRDGGPRSGILRSALTLWFPGRRPETTVSAALARCGARARGIALGFQGSPSFSAFLAAHRHARRCTSPDG
jgi:hypothetical protein